MNNVVSIANKRDWKYHAARISEAWQGGVTSIVEAGRRLIEAQNELEHGQWGDMVSLKLPFNLRTAQKLIAVAQHPILSNASHATHLPPSWNTLYQLTQVDKKLGEGTLLAWIKEGKISAKTQRKDVNACVTCEPSKQRGSP